MHTHLPGTLDRLCDAPVRLCREPRAAPMHDLAKGRDKLCKQLDVLRPCGRQGRTTYQMHARQITLVAAKDVDVPAHLYKRIASRRERHVGGNVFWKVELRQSHRATRQAGTSPGEKCRAPTPTPTPTAFGCWPWIPAGSALNSVAGQRATLEACVSMGEGDGLAAPAAVYELPSGEYQWSASV